MKIYHRHFNREEGGIPWWHVEPDSTIESFPIPTPLPSTETDNLSTQILLSYLSRQVISSQDEDGRDE